MGVFAIDVVDRDGALQGPSPGRTRCIRPCRFLARAPWHHDRLLGITDAVENIVELFDLALTWFELDYSEQSLIAPSDWPVFLAGHSWPDPALATRTFGLARDIATRGVIGSETAYVRRTVRGDCAHLHLASMVTA